MSDTMDICGLKAERGQKLQTYIPVLDIFITPLLIKFYFVNFDTIILILFLLISITYDSMFIQYLLSIKLKNILE